MRSCLYTEVHLTPTAPKKKKKEREAFVVNKVSLVEKMLLVYSDVYNE